MPCPCVLTVFLRSPMKISVLYLKIGPVLVAARSKTWVARLLILWVRIPPGAWMCVCCECCVLSGRGFCDGLITRPKESYRLWCVVVCDLETPWMGRPWPTGGCCAKKKITFTYAGIESPAVPLTHCSSWPKFGPLWQSLKQTKIQTKKIWLHTFFPQENVRSITEVKLEWTALQN